MVSGQNRFFQADKLGNDISPERNFLQKRYQRILTKQAGQKGHSLKMLLQRLQKQHEQDGDFTFVEAPEIHRLLKEK